MFEDDYYDLHYDNYEDDDVYSQKTDDSIIDDYYDYRNEFPSGPEGDDMYESWMDDLDD